MDESGAAAKSFSALVRLDEKRNIRGWEGGLAATVQQELTSESCQALLQTLISEHTLDVV